MYPSIPLLELGLVAHDGGTPGTLRTRRSEILREDSKRRLGSSSGGPPSVHDVRTRHSEGTQPGPTGRDTVRGNFPYTWETETQESVVSTFVVIRVDLSETSFVCTQNMRLVDKSEDENE